MPWLDIVKKNLNFRGIDSGLTDSDIALTPTSGLHEAMHYDLIALQK